MIWILIGFVTWILAARINDECVPCAWVLWILGFVFFCLAG